MPRSLDTLTPRIKDLMPRRLDPCPSLETYYNGDCTLVYAVL